MSEINRFRIYFTALAMQEFEVDVKENEALIGWWIAEKCNESFVGLPGANKDQISVGAVDNSSITRVGKDFVVTLDFNKASLNARFGHSEYKAYPPDQFLCLRLNDFLGNRSSAPEAPRSHVTKVELCPVG